MQSSFFSFKYIFFQLLMTYKKQPTLGKLQHKRESACLIKQHNKYAITGDFHQNSEQSYHKLSCKTCSISILKKDKYMNRYVYNKKGIILYILIKWAALKMWCFYIEERIVVL